MAASQLRLAGTSRVTNDGGVTVEASRVFQRNS